MELAAPGIKKEYCRVAINNEGNLTIAIEKGGVRDVDNIEGVQKCKPGSCSVSYQNLIT